MGSSTVGVNGRGHPVSSWWGGVPWVCVSNRSLCLNLGPLPRMSDTESGSRCGGTCGGGGVSATLLRWSTFPLPRSVFRSVSPGSVSTTSECGARHWFRPPRRTELMSPTPKVRTPTLFHDSRFPGSHCTAERVRLRGGGAVSVQEVSERVHTT